MSKSETLELTSLNAKTLVELQGWEEKQNAIVEANPFIEITDRVSYEEAKKRRTALVKARTAIQGQNTIIKDKLNAFKSQVSEASDSLIGITKPHEEKQQTEVKRYEAEKEKEREEKAEKERVRVQKIKDKIHWLDMALSAIIIKLTFENISECRAEFEKIINDIKDDFDFEEFEVLFDEKVESQCADLNQKIDHVTEKEQHRKEQLQARQKAEVDKHYQIGTRIIQEATFEGRDVLIDNVGLSFETEFDFGEFQDEFMKSRNYVLDMAAKKVGEFNAQIKEREERKKEQDKATQIANLSDLQNHLMNTILGMDAENYEISAVDLDSLKEERVGYNYIEDKFDAMFTIVKKTQDEKLASVLKTIEEEKSRKQSQLEDRFEMLEMLGLTRNEGRFIGFGKAIGEKVVEYNSKEEFEELLNSVQDAKQKQEDNESRKEALASDVAKIEAWISGMQTDIDLNEVLPKLEHKESIDFVDGFKKELNSWFELKFNQVKSI